MRWPLITRKRHDRLVVAQAIATGHELGDAQRAVATSQTKANAVANDRVARWLNGMADAHDLDADHLDGRESHQKRTVAPATASTHRVVADQLRDVARDVESRDD